MDDAYEALSISSSLFTWFVAYVSNLVFQPAVRPCFPVPLFGLMMLACVANAVNAVTTCVFVKVFVISHSA